MCSSISLGTCTRPHGGGVERPEHPAEATLKPVSERDYETWCAVNGTRQSPELLATPLAHPHE